MAQWQITGAQHCHLRLCPNQPLFQLLQHIHFAWYVNFKFSNLITLKKVNIQKLIWQYNHFDEQATATLKISTSNDLH
jgi:hypothetical protein